MSKITPHDLDSIATMFEAGDWKTLELRFGTTDLFLSKVPGLAPSWDRTATEQPETVPANRSLPSSASPASAKDRSADVATAAAADVPPGHVLVKAPSLGTFYRAPKPGDPPFVEIGQTVTADTELCLVEVMKLFTTLRAGVDGKVARVLAKDGAMIELGQPLFLIETHG